MLAESFGKSPMQFSVPDMSYPHRIRSFTGKNAPKKIYALGNGALLRYPGLGFCGSRKASESGIAVARDCAVQAAQNGICVVSGNAAGVDCAAHFSSLEAGGTTILVIPEGINHFRIRKALRPVWDWDRVLVLSPFEPDEPWKAFRAMARNGFILALSRAMLVIEAGEKGGTFHAGEEALKLGITLFVADYQNSEQAGGNRILLNKGAHRLAKSKTTNKASFKPVLEAVRQDRGLAKYTAQATLAL
ncbi:MAG: hypothetical protein DU429_06580 [Candidatus Tokpelaia sp.]|nr:MAG: hypothetical protein DU430_04430 [Candidatus Tokpelaia sp.]KAA6206224.1 MAG: hypothetical protein DU429_06580 [Candidatus Tokpelaia sp.]